MNLNIYVYTLEFSYTYLTNITNYTRKISNVSISNMDN